MKNFYKSQGAGFFYWMGSTGSNQQRVVPHINEPEKRSLEDCANWCLGEGTCVGFSYHRGDGIQKQFWYNGQYSNMVVKCWSYHQGFIMDHEIQDTDVDTYTKCDRGT